MKVILRVLLEKPSFGAVRDLLTRKDAAAEKRFLNAVSRRLASAVLSPARFRTEVGEGKGRTLFILGSGASVERLEESEWAKVRENVSFGINSWVLHDFVPDVYAYEPVASGNSGHSRLMSLLGRPDIVERNPWILFLKPRNRIEESQLRQIPKKIAHRTLLYGRFQPATRRPENLVPDLLRTLKRCLRRDLPMVPDSGASVVRLAALGILMGFEEIVFVGVDLNGSQYFWEANPSHLERNSLTDYPHLQAPGKHETMSRKNRPFVVLEMINALRVCGDFFGSRLFVESADSALAQHLDTYTWNKS